MHHKFSAGEQWKRSVCIISICLSATAKRVTQLTPEVAVNLSVAPVEQYSFSSTHWGHATSVVTYPPTSWTAMSSRFPIFFWRLKNCNWILNVTEKEKICFTHLRSKFFFATLVGLLKRYIDCMVTTSAKLRKTIPKFQHCKKETLQTDTVLRNTSSSCWTFRFLAKPWQM